MFYQVKFEVVRTKQIEREVMLEVMGMLDVGEMSIRGHCIGGFAVFRNKRSKQYKTVKIKLVDRDGVLMWKCLYLSYYYDRKTCEKQAKDFAEIFHSPYLGVINFSKRTLLDATYLPFHPSHLRKLKENHNVLETK